MNIDVTVPVESLTVAKKQVVAIMQPSTTIKILIMDEPSAVDGSQESMFIVKDLREKGITIIYISHRLEVFELCTT